MRAVVFDHYTDLAGLELREVAPPSPTAGQVVVRIAAAGLNPFDWHMYRGEPWIMRTSGGWRVRETRTVGADIAGTVTAVGEGVTTLAVGDRVFGSIGYGGLADVAAADAARLARIDDSVSWVAAAATPMAALTALQALRDTGALAAGGRVLVWGASGGVGHLAVQIARILGASTVDAVASASHADFLRALGADRAHDRRVGVPASAGPYDVVIDTVGSQSIRQLTPLLAPGARIVTVGSTSRGRVLGPATALLSRTIGGAVQRVAAKGIFATVRASDLELIAEWLASGSIHPEVQQVYPLGAFADALATLEAGHVRGKLVIEV